MYTAADPERNLSPRGQRVRPGPGRARRGFRREPLPGLRRAGARAAPLGGARPLARLGIRLGEGRAARRLRDHLHRPVGRGDAAARRQEDRVRAPGGTGGTARAVERRASARPGRRTARRPNLSATRSWSRRPRAAAAAASAWSVRPRTSRRRSAGRIEDGRGRHGLPGAGHPRHVEVQVVANAEGTVWTLGVQYSVQRKVIEESATRSRTSPARRARDSSAAPATRTPGRWSSSTTRQTRRSFLEVNARLQVEHTGDREHRLQLVKLQTHGARAGAISPESRTPRARHRGPASRRGCGERLRAGPGRIEMLRLQRPGRGCGSTPCGAGRRHPARFRLDDRQGHRVGPGPRGPGRFRAIRRTTAHDQQGVPARPARPAEFVRGEIDWDTMMAEACAAAAGRRGPAGHRLQEPTRSTDGARGTGCSRRPNAGAPRSGTRPGTRLTFQVGGEAYKLGGIRVGHPVRIASR